MPNHFTDQQTAYIEAHTKDRVGFQPRDGTEEQEPGDFDHGSQLKSKIRNGRAAPAAPGTIHERIREFNEYLRLAEAFYLHVEDQPTGQIEWEEGVLPALRRELDRTTSLLDRLGSPEVGGDLEEALAPLWAHTAAFDRWGGVPTPSVPPEEPEEVPADGYPEAVEELHARVEGLKRLLEDVVGETAAEDLSEGEYLHEILTWIHEHEDDPKINGKRQQRASRTLGLADPDLNEGGGHLGLVRKKPWGFGVTERGEAVLAAFENLMGTPAFGPLDEEGRAETALRALDHLFD